MNRHSALVLASASPRRRELLTALGVPFAVAPADVDEALMPGEAPDAAVRRLATLKAEAAARRFPDSLVLAADTLVVLDGRILAKPADADEAAAMLRGLRDRQHTVVTGVALLNAGGRRVQVAAPVSRVTMRDYTDAEIGASIAAGTPFDKAGAYAIQDQALAPVSRVDGCSCNVVGLPLWTAWSMIRAVCPSATPRPPGESRPTCAACPLAAEG